jgi:hypothetical protein
MMKGVTDSDCNAVLTSLMSAGSCGGGGKENPGDGGGATECAALSACCAILPAAEDPTECASVAMDGTAEACSATLVMFQRGGYCGGGTADAG